ncbi:MAG: ribosome biogenesis GTPase YlqF [Lachnospiraceae bacterium]|nr:ribosome biogenesis GTPase YlqF [Lachnospiraceae bacterium]
MPIQWYPGHMTKAKRMMQEDIRLIDLVIELLDARIPRSSRNPDIDELAKGKSRLVLLNKSDLSDPEINEKWYQYFKQKGFVTLLTDSKNRKGFGPIHAAVEEACAEKLMRDRKKGITGRPVRAMVVGIPNVGKSTFINSLCKKASAKTGNRPGVTKGKQWIRLDKSVELLDTPGILWPKFEDEKTGINLALIGSISDQIIDEGELAAMLIDHIRKHSPGIMAGRYEIDENDETAAIFDAIALKRGCIKKGGLPDYDKAAHIILDDLRSGKLGRISLEEPEQ